jgi:signal peptidase I
MQETEHPTDLVVRSEPATAPESEDIAREAGLHATGIVTPAEVPVASTSAPPPGRPADAAAQYSAVTEVADMSVPSADVVPRHLVTEGASQPVAAAEIAAQQPPTSVGEAVGVWTRTGREILAGFQTLLSAAVYATLIVTFGFQVARVDGLSMAPTLEDHDRLIVNKLVYELGEPRPGDIVMLYYPLNPEKMFVKRVIAKEGDTVRIVDGHVYVNDIPLHDDYVPAEFRSHDDWGPQLIPQGYYFVMGDHRNNSSDSRHWGMVPKKYIVGKVKVRWWPLQDARIF